MIDTKILQNISEDDKTGNVLKDMIYFKDYKSQQLIIYFKDKFYFIPIQNMNFCLSFDFTDIPKNITEFIIKNIFMTHNYRVNKMYKTNVKNDILKKYPTLEIIINILLSFYKNPINVEEKIELFDMSKNKNIDINFKQIINYLLKK